MEIINVVTMVMKENILVSFPGRMFISNFKFTYNETKGVIRSRNPKDRQLV